MEVEINGGFELGAFHYEIKNDGEIHKELISRDCYGECDNQNRVIKIGSHGVDQMRSTFIHECIEAVNWQNCNGKLKHDEIKNIGNGLAQIMKSMGVDFIYRK